MDPAYYVAAGSLKARSFQLETVSNNLANAATVGYKTERSFFAVFNKALQSNRNLPLSGPLNDGTVLGQRGIDFSQGATKATGRALDIALEGEGFLMVETPQGQRATRDGRLSMGTNGTLTTLEGYTVLGKNGQPIKVNPQGGSLSFTRDGSVQQDGQPVGRLEIKDFENAGNMSREGANRYDPAGLKERPAKAFVVGGHLEQSTVDTPSVMVDMIRLNRLYEMSMKVASTLSNDLDGRSINSIAMGQ